MVALTASASVVETDDDDDSSPISCLESGFLVRTSRTEASTKAEHITERILARNVPGDSDPLQLSVAHTVSFFPRHVSPQLL